MSCILSRIVVVYLTVSSQRLGGLGFGIHLPSHCLFVPGYQAADGRITGRHTCRLLW